MALSVPSPRPSCQAAPLFGVGALPAAGMLFLVGGQILFGSRGSLSARLLGDLVPEPLRSQIVAAVIQLT